MNRAAQREALDEILFTTEQLSQRWSLRVETLENQRSAGVGLPYMKLPSGPVRYRASDILDAEANGMRGLTADRVSKAIMACPLIDNRKAGAVARWVQEQLSKKG